MIQTDPGAPRVSALELFLAFGRLTLHSFGGALFWSRRMMVEERRWLNDQEFAELLALAQLLPGGNGVNLSVIVGYRFRGIAGAAAAMSGFIGAPLVIVIALGVLYQNLGGLPVVKDVLTGMSSVAVGLLIATAMQLTGVLKRRWLPWLFVLLTFTAVGVLRWPLIAVVGALAPFAIAFAWREKR